MPSLRPLPASEFTATACRVFDAFAVSDSDEYLTHDEFPVDEPAWLEPDDVVAGIDTVVRRAICWIRRSAANLESAAADGAWDCHGVSWP